jgi:hypothetical protein
VGKCHLLHVISISEGWQTPSCISVTSLNQFRNSLLSVTLRCSLLIHNSLQLDLILSQILFTPCFFMIHSNFILMFISSKWSTPFMFPDQLLYTFLTSPVSQHIMLLFTEWINSNSVAVGIEQAQKSHLC